VMHAGVRAFIVLQSERGHGLENSGRGNDDLLQALAGGTLDRRRERINKRSQIEEPCPTGNAGSKTALREGRQEG